MSERGADVAVAGAGVIGSAVAYYAALRGLRVVVFDAPRPGQATTASAAGLWPVGESLGFGCSLIFYRAMRGAGRRAVAGSALPEPFLDFALRSNAMFPALAEELRARTGVDIELDPSSLVYALASDEDERTARALLSRPCHASGAVERLSAPRLRRLVPWLSPLVRSGLLFRGEDQVNPYRFAAALRQAARALGARFLVDEPATRIVLARGRVAAVESARRRVPCGAVVNAAGAWSAQVGRLAGVTLPVRPVRGQLLCTEPLPGRLGPAVTTSDVYVVQKAHGEALIGSTVEQAGFDAGVTPEAMSALAAAAVRALPALARVRVKRCWAGLRAGTPDQLPILGAVSGVRGYLNACHYRKGILNAPLTGLSLAQVLCGEEPEASLEPFALARFGGGVRPRTARAAR